MNKKTFKDYVCKPYCIFFKDGEKEEMACHGAVIAQRLVKNNKINPLYFGAEPFKKDTRFNVDEDLLSMVCGNCPFEAQDCDFRSSSPPEGSVPCGGYILLFLLKSKGLLTAIDVGEVCIEES
ncbi:MAG: hypothetical protein MUP22_16195 [Desulfobacterales bacterium]|nr:hypothetical protein [Desulfobacterales bacterium]